MIIYKVTNLINGKIYIGKDAYDRPNYLGSGTYIKRALKKYGKKNFKKETLDTCTETDWQEKEKYWILKLSSRDPSIGYNILEGGYGSPSGEKNPFYGVPLDSDHKNKISESIKQHWTTRERKPKSDTRRFWFDFEGNLHIIERNHK